MNITDLTNAGVGLASTGAKAIDEISGQIEQITPLAEDVAEAKVGTSSDLQAMALLRAQIASDLQAMQAIAAGGSNGQLPDGTQVADEQGSFTLTASRLVSFGAVGKSWAEKTLPAGTYTCNLTTFDRDGTTDPAPLTAKVCILGHVTT
jgi:hypothetical protein